MIEKTAFLLKISVVVPTLNEAEKIASTVAYLAKTGGDRLAEILVVDAKSTDQTAFLAEKAGATVLFSDQKSRAGQLNLGAKAAIGAVVYFVHADVLPPESWAEDIAVSMEKGATMGCFRYRFDSKSWLLRINSWCTRLPFMWCQGGDKTFFMAKKDFLQLAGYDETMVVMEEYDFLRRAKKAGFRLFTVPKNAVVSARKYAERSWLRVNLANFVAFNLFRFGANSLTIKKAYSRLLG